MRFTLVTLLSLVGFFLNSCADDPSLDEVASAADDILSGTRDRSAHPAVLALALPDGGLCTSALVGPRLLLTARHCVSETVDRIDCASRAPQVVRDLDPTSIAVLAGDDARTRTVLARGERIVTPRTRRLCEADIALVVLDRELRSITPMRVDFAPRLSTGDAVTVVGFGARGSSSRSSSGLRYRRARVPIVDWGASEFAAGRVACRGDSGGPAIDPRTGAIVGVHSRGSEPCTDVDAIGIWTRVHVARALFDAANR